MDEDDNTLILERASKLGFKPQKENVYNNLLPFSDKIDQEAVAELNLIRTNLVKTLSARELKPGFYLWSLRFEQFIKLYGLMFSKEDHLKFIKLYLEVITIVKQESMCLVKWCDILSLLLKKRHLVSRDDLQIEWRPLYEIYTRAQENSKTYLGYSKHQAHLESSLLTLIKFCRVYFPTSATQEILDECKPKMCPFSEADISECFEILQLFMPICVGRNEENSNSHILWFDEFMNFWESCIDDNFWENSMMSLVARLSANHMGRIDFEKYFPLMYARFARSFQLPVLYKMRSSTKCHSIDVSPIAVWIVSTLKSENSFNHLENFLQMIRSFLYTANVGRWTTKLKDLFNKLSLYFVNRIYFERYRKRSWEREIPVEFKLNDDEIDRFVLALKPCLELAMFSRSLSNDVSHTFQRLASLRPHLIIPMTLEKLYASLDSLTEPHRLISAMSAVVSVSRHMATGASRNYPEGPTHIIPLLFAVLPGIDPNDFRKCITTFHFITQFVCMVPIINSSEAANYHELTEEEHVICEATSGFEDFVVQFFDKICVWVESCSLDFIRPEQQTSELNVRGGMEFMSEHAMSSVITVILRQCSPEIFRAALKKVFNFISNNILEVDVAGRLAAFLCGSFSKINPKESLKLFVPYLCDKIESLLDEHAAKEEHLDGEILYNLLILSEVVDGRNEVIFYVERLINILDLTLHMNCVQATKISIRLLTFMLATLSSIQPAECRSSDKSYSTQVKDFLPIREWGFSMRAKDLKVEWYKPGENEMKMIEFLIHRYLIPELEKLNKYTEKKLDLSRVELRNSLKIINAVMVSHIVLPIWDEPSIQLFESAAHLPKFQPIETGTYKIAMPDGSNVRKTIADTLHKVQKRLLETDEGDTKSIFVLANIQYTLLFNKVQILDLETVWKNFTILKKITENRLLDKKKHLRHILIDRCTLQQCVRIESSNYAFTETHKQILLDLFELSVSRYRDVRVYSQSKLLPIINNFPYSYRVLKEKFKQILQIDTENYHEMFKGCLFVLYSSKGASILIKQDWEFLNEIWPLLITSKPSEKLSIINLITSISESVCTNFQTPAIDWEVPENVMENVEKIISADFPEYFEEQTKLETKQILNRKNEENKKNYGNLVVSLLSACENRNLHWRYKLLSCGFLRDVVHPDIKYNESVVKYFLNSLIDDSILIRKIAIKVTIFILIQQKLSYKKIEVDPAKYSSSSHRIEAIPGHREDNQWLLYKLEDLPKNSADWNEPKFLHNVSHGYYTWPKPYKTYAPSSDQPHLDEAKISCEQEEIVKFFTDVGNVEKLVYFLSLEDKKGKDRFDNNKALIFKYLAKLMEEKILVILLPHLEKLAVEKQESSQRCAAEILSGLIRGSKHWSFEKTEKLWFNIIPIIQGANQNILNETIQDWTICFSISLCERDSRKYHWLIEFLLDDPLADPTSFIAGVKIYFLANALYQQSWRNSQLNTRFYDYLKKHMTHPFQLIRTKISTSLKTIFTRDYIPPNGKFNENPKISEFFNEYMPEMDWLYNDTLKKIKVEAQNDPEEARREETIRMFKIISKYIASSMICRSNLYTPIEFYEILQLTCVLQNNDVDEEIQPMCMNILALLAQNIMPEAKMNELLNILEEIIKCPLWSARSALVEFLSTFVFHNMSILASRPEWVEKVKKFAMVSLEDTQPEVREKACKFLSGLLHCNFLPNPLDLLHNFKVKARTKLNKSKSNSNSIAVNNLIIRHSGVLGLCAFINSTPYDVPEFLPDIFGILGLHLSDPQPIPSTIRKTLGEFKRTHQDNWEVHKMQFTEEQMLVFRDLTVPPSYYV